MTATSSEKTTQPLPRDWAPTVRRPSRTLPPPSMRHTARSMAATAPMPFGGDECPAVSL